MGRINTYTTSTLAAADDYIITDGTTNGTRKMLASTLIGVTTLDSGAAANLLLKYNGTTGITLGASSAVTLAGNLTVSGTGTQQLGSTSADYVSIFPSGSEEMAGYYTTEKRWGLSWNSNSAWSVGVAYASAGGLRVGAATSFAYFLGTTGGNAAIKTTGGTTTFVDTTAATAYNAASVTLAGGLGVAKEAIINLDLKTNASRTKHVKVVTATYTQDTTTADEVIVGNHATVAFTITLLSAASTTGRSIVIKNRGAATVTVAAAAAASEIFSTSAVASVALTTGQSITIISDGQFWNVC